jgi:cyanate permease
VSRPAPFTGFNRLARAELVLFLLLVLHTVDHGINQPSRDLPTGAGLIGVGGFVIVAIAIVLAIGRSRNAALAGALAGGLTVLGFLSIHLIGFGPFADPYRDFDANALSWILLIAPTLAAAAVTVIAVGDLREQGARQATAAP